MDSMIPLGQKNTLTEYMILFGADNRPPMLDKDLVAKDLWERVQLIMQGTSLTKQERECKLYDAFDKSTHIKGESFHKYYLRFTQLINDMNIYNMKIEQFQVNTKFLNSLPPEWRDDLIACLNKARVVKCYNCQGEGHLDRQCTQPKRPRNETWYKDKAMLVEAQEAGQILDEKQLAFLADPGVPDGQAVQTIIPNNAAFQTKDLHTYDSDCDDILNAKVAVLMANISNYGSALS
nr:hypothetical protein [Tanacetum cinerariifolium]